MTSDNLLPSPAIEADEQVVTEISDSLAQEAETQEIFWFADLTLGNDSTQEQSAGSHPPLQPSPADDAQRRKSKASIIENRLEVRCSNHSAMTDNDWHEYFYQQFPQHRNTRLCKVIKVSLQEKSCYVIAEATEVLTMESLLSLVGVEGQIPISMSSFMVTITVDFQEILDELKQSPLKIFVSSSLSEKKIFLRRSGKQTISIGQGELFTLFSQIAELEIKEFSPYVTEHLLDSLVPDSNIGQTTFPARQFDYKLIDAITSLSISLQQHLSISRAGFTELANFGGRSRSEIDELKARFGFVTEGVFKSRIALRQGVQAAEGRRVRDLNELVRIVSGGLGLGNEEQGGAVLRIIYNILEEFKGFGYAENHENQWSTV